MKRLEGAVFGGLFWYPYWRSTSPSPPKTVAGRLFSVSTYTSSNRLYAESNLCTRFRQRGFDLLGSNTLVVGNQNSWYVEAQVGTFKWFLTLHITITFLTMFSSLCLLWMPWHSPWSCPGGLYNHRCQFPWAFVLLTESAGSVFH